MNKSTILRQITMLKIIPKYPGFVLTKDLHRRLDEEGFSTSLRTVERDLVKLADVMGLISEEGAGGYQWAYINHARELLPALSPNESLLLMQAKQHLQNVMPFKALRSLEPRFDKAEATLAQNKTMANWQDKIRVVQGMVPLITTEINDAVREEVYEAILKEEQIQIVYEKNSGDTGDYSLNTHGLIIKDYVQYLVASKSSSPNVLQLFKLSQIQQASPKYLDNMHCNEDITAFINSDVSGFMIEQNPIELTMNISGSALTLLTNAKLSDTQHLEPFIGSTGRACARLTATVDFTFSLVHFLLGYGKFVEVLAPQSLIDALEERSVGEIF